MKNLKLKECGNDPSCRMCKILTSKSDDKISFTMTELCKDFVCIKQINDKVIIEISSIDNYELKTSKKYNNTFRLICYDNNKIQIDPLTKILINIEKSNDIECLSDVYYLDVSLYDSHNKKFKSYLKWFVLEDIILKENNKLTISIEDVNSIIDIKTIKFAFECSLIKIKKE